MSRTRLVLFGSIACLASLAGTGAAQAPATSAASATAPHTIVINLVQRPGPMAFAFEPATFAAHHGDTLRFVQAASVMHNVHFKTQPKGAHLGAAAMSQYLTAKGQVYTLVVDSRFADGTYEIVCDPHEMIGMHAFLTVTGAATAVAAGKP
jgi:plastocyanin